MGIHASDKFHEALYDVKVLEKLTSLTCKEDLFHNYDSYVQSLHHVKDLQKTAAMLPSLVPLKKIISDGMLKKMARQGITFEMLKSEFDKGGKEKLLEFLSEPLSNKKPKVTKNKRVLCQLCNYFESKKNLLM